MQMENIFLLDADDLTKEMLSKPIKQQLKKTMIWFFATMNG